MTILKNPRVRALKCTVTSLRDNRFLSFRKRNLYLKQVWIDRIKTLSCNNSSVLSK